MTHPETTPATPEGDAISKAAAIAAAEVFNGPASDSDFLNGQSTAAQQIIAALRSLPPQDGERERLRADLAEMTRRRDEWRNKAEGYDTLAAAVRKGVEDAGDRNLSRVFMRGAMVEAFARAEKAEAALADYQRIMRNEADSHFRLMEAHSDHHTALVVAENALRVIASPVLSHCALMDEENRRHAALALGEIARYRAHALTQWSEPAALTAQPVALPTCLHLTAAMAERCQTCNPGANQNYADPVSSSAPVSAGKVKALAEKLRAELVDHGYQDEGKMVRLCDRILSALQPGDGWQGIESLDDLREAIADEERTLQAQIAQMHAGTRDSGPREYERLAWAAFCRITANIPPDPPASLPQGEETR